MPGRHPAGKLRPMSSHDSPSGHDRAELAALLDLAVRVARAGGLRTLAWFNNDVATEWKADGSPVTRADREAEEVMRELIAAACPTHQIVGEEHGTTVGSDPRYRWILDPIDGTKTFVRGVPMYGTLVGLEIDGAAMVGAIYIPPLDEMVAAATGLGCTWNGRRARVSDTDALEDALLVCTDERAVRQRLPEFELGDAVQLRRTWADCYGYVLVATGRAEIAMDPIMNVWDCAPLLPILEEAGGRFTTWSGARTIDGGDAVATNGRLHDSVLASLAGALPSSVVTE